MPADHVTERTFAPIPTRWPVRRGAHLRRGRAHPLPPFWWFLPSVALGLAFWIVVLALVLA